MFTHYSTPAFVLEEKEKGEADKKYSLLSEKFGRIKVVGKSIRKIDSKLRSGILPFSFSIVEFIQGRYYKILTYTETVDDLAGIRSNLHKLRTAYRMREVFNKLVRGQEEDVEIWQLVAQSFKRLDSLDPGESGPAFFLHYLVFGFNLLSVTGYEPEIRRCLKCNRRLKPEKLYFCSRGGLVCERCSSFFPEEEMKEVSVSEVKMMREIEKGDPGRLRRIKFDKRLLGSVTRTLHFYLDSIY